MILTVIFIVLTIIRLVYYVVLFSRIGRCVDKIQDGLQIKSDIEDPGVSIIVCAKNEYNNLQVLLPALINQSYVNKEIIIVDDYSTDNTRNLRTRFPTINWLTPLENIEGKKSALSYGIELAVKEWILLTDADCIPGNEWVESMVANRGNSDVILGYSPMIKKSGLINLFSRYETYLTAIQYLSYSILGIPYMGVGRNIMYRKTIFKAVDGFESHRDVLSGDDDLFVQSAIDHGNIGINLDQKSFVYTHTEVKWKGFITQKLRHISTSYKYKLKHQMMLSIFAISHIMWSMALIYSLVSGTAKTTIVVITGVYWMLCVIAQYKTSKRLSEKSILPFYPVLDIMTSIYYIIMAIVSGLNIKRKQNTWS